MFRSNRDGLLPVETRMLLVASRVFVLFVAAVAVAAVVAVAVEPKTA